MKMKNLLIDASVPGARMLSDISQLCVSEYFWCFILPAWGGEGGERRDVVFVDVDNVALIFMLVMSFLGTTNMNIKQIANISPANIQH